MGHKPIRRPFGLDLRRRLPKGQSLGLSEDVGKEHVMVPAERIQRLVKRDEVAGYESGPLMNQLVEGMLAIGSRLAPIDGAGRVSDLCAVEGDVFAVALHRQLLQVGWESLQILLIRQHGDCLRTEEIVVPECEKPHEHWQVAFEWGGAKMLVHLVEAIQHGSEI